MTDILVATQRLYDAINAKDVRALRAALHPQFVGTVSDGMPCGVGGRHHGPDAMLRDCWGVIFATYDVAVEVHEHLMTRTDVVAFVGRYLGTERSTGQVVDAAFAHVLRVEGDQIIALRQITDTARWGAGAAA